MTGSAAAFTMIEIALSIAVVAFALVAIIGVLPTGMRVKKDNQEDTIIREDAALWIEAIRNGAQAADEFTNHVEEVVMRRSRSNVVSGTMTFLNATTVTNFTSFGAPGPVGLSGGGVAISLLSHPKYLPLSNQEVLLTEPTARVRAITGTAIARNPASTNREFAFRYQISSEIVPYAAFNANQLFLSSEEVRRGINLTNNLYELRVTMRWPVFPRGAGWAVGNNRKSFRTLMAGYPYRTNLVSTFPGVSTNLFLFRPNTFVNATF